MEFRKSVVFALISIVPSMIYASYDIEMFTFYPYHCESNLLKQMKKVFQCKAFNDLQVLF